MGSVAQGPTTGLLVGIGSHGQVIMLGDERSLRLWELVQKRESGLNVVYF